MDDADYEELTQYRWSLREGRHRDRYAQRMTPRVDGKATTVLMHRQIMGFPSERVDHRDGDGLNNQRANLRCATAGLNSWNRRGADRDSSTGYRGVSRHRSGYRAHAQVNGVYHHLGIYSTPEKAAQVAADFRASVPDSLLGTG